MAKVDTKSISENLDVEVQHDDNGYTVTCINKNTTTALAVRVNFSNSTNLKPHPAPGCKNVGDFITEATVNAGVRMVVAKLEPIDAAEKYSYKYTCATQLRKAPAAAAAAPAPAPASAPAPSKAAPAAASAPASAPATKPAAASAGDIAAPAGTEETERKNLTANLDILIHSINNGYNLQIQNTDAAASFTVVLDVAESQNLLINAEGAAKVEGKQVTVTIPPKSTVAVVDMPVDNWDLGSCELRYKASIRKQ